MIITEPVCVFCGLSYHKMTESTSTDVRELKKLSEQEAYKFHTKLTTIASDQWHVGLQLAWITD